MVLLTLFRVLLLNFVYYMIHSLSFTAFFPAKMFLTFIAEYSLWCFIMTLVVSICMSQDRLFLLHCHEKAPARFSFIRSQFISKLVLDPLKLKKLLELKGKL